MKKTLLTLMLSLSLQAQAMQEDRLIIEYNKHVVVTHPGLGECQWTYDGITFTVVYEEQEYVVKPAYIDKILRGITKEELIMFLNHGYLYVNRLDDGEFTIKAKGRVDGGFGFFILAGIGAGLTAEIINWFNDTTTIEDKKLDEHLERMEKIITENDTKNAVEKERVIPKVDEITSKLKLDDGNDLIDLIKMDEAILVGEGKRVDIIDKGGFGKCHQFMRNDARNMVDTHCLIGPGIPIPQIPIIARAPSLRIVPNFPQPPIVIGPITQA